jgi:cob(I)alamin adenosyltransferase
MRSQVTTKRGDAGETTALSGDSFPKSHDIMECVGTLDELRAHTALARLRILDEKPRDFDRAADFLMWLLHVYFLIGSACSDPLNKHPEYRKRDVGPGDLERLEAEQQWLEEQTPLPQSFIVSASNTVSAQVDVACTVVRRLERNLVRMKESVPEFASADVFRFVNRLSDTLYMLARKLEHPVHETVRYESLEPRTRKGSSDRS